MKNYLLFISSFIFLMTCFEVLSGLFLTFIYTPNITEAWNQSAHSSQATILSNQSYLPSLLFVFLAATIAYFIPKVFTRIKSRNK